MEQSLAKKARMIVIHPEDEELQRKRADLEGLESELAQRELDLATLVREIEAFRKKYVHRLGPTLAELARLEAEIQEALAAFRPNDNTLRETAQEARRQANEARRAIEDEPDEPLAPKPPNDRLKALYRQTAKAMHPDLATDEEDRKLRTRMMAEVNAAFAVGDDALIERLLREWTSRPEAVTGEGTAAELVRVIRKIAQVRKRLEEIKIEMDALLKNEWIELRLQYETCNQDGQDFFETMLDGIQKRIEHARARLKKLASAA